MKEEDDDEGIKYEDSDDITVSTSPEPATDEDDDNVITDDFDVENTVVISSCAATVDGNSEPLVVAMSSEAATDEDVDSGGNIEVVAA